jgi:hypothetical protein
MATRVADGSDAQADLARQKRPLSARPARCRASRRRSLDLTDSNRSPFTPTARQLPPQRYAARTIIGLARSPLPFFCFPRVAELSHAPRRRLLRRRERATRSSVRPRPHGQVFPRNCRRCEHCAHLCRAAGFPRQRAQRPQRGDLYCRHFPRTPHLEPARRSRALAGKVVSSLGSTLAEAMARGQVARNVVHEAARGDRRRARVEKRHTRKLQVGVDLPTKDELRAMLEHAGQLRPLLTTAIFTGLRASELRGLEWEDVNFELRVLTVRQRADRWNTLGSPKSSAGRREVPLAPIVITTLREWKLAFPRFAGDGERRLRFVFPDSDGGIDSHHNIHRSRGLGRVQHDAGITTDARAPKYGLAQPATHRGEPVHRTRVLTEARAGLDGALDWDDLRYLWAPLSERRGRPGGDEPIAGPPDRVTRPKRRFPLPPTKPSKSVGAGAGSRILSQGPATAPQRGPPVRWRIPHAAGRQRFIRPGARHRRWRARDGTPAPAPRSLVEGRGSARARLFLAGFDRQPGIEFHVYPARLFQLCL